jgi:branched-chain amino acid transport system permease protein
MMGAFIGLSVAKVFGVNIFLSMPVAMIGAALIGLAVERVAFTPLRGADPYSGFLSSLGPATALPIIAQMIWGAVTQPYPAGIKFEVYEAGGVTISSMQILIIVVTLLLLVALYVFVQKTPLGTAMRAISHSVPLSQLMGIDVNYVIRITFAISAALAAAGGVLVSAYYDAIFPTMGFNAGIKAFTAAVVGGIGSIPGTVLGGFLLGLAENLASGYISSGLRDAIAFVILVVVLLVKPSGLLGKDLIQKM